MENNVLDFALKTVLEELGCTIDINENIATIQCGPTRLKLEKRANYWYDLEKNLWFYSRSMILIYMARDGRLRG